MIPVTLIGRLEPVVIASFKAFMTSTYKVYTNEEMKADVFTGLMQNILLNPVLVYDGDVISDFTVKNDLDPRILFCKHRVLSRRFDGIMAAAGLDPTNCRKFWKKNWHVVAKHILFFDSVAVVKKFKDEVTRLATESLGPAP